MEAAGRDHRHCPGSEASWRRLRPFDGCDRDVLIRLVSLRQTQHGGDLQKACHQGVAGIGALQKIAW